MGIDREQLAQLLFAALESEITNLIHDELEVPDLWSPKVLSEAFERMESAPRTGDISRSFIDYLYFQQKLEGVAANKNTLQMIPRGAATIARMQDLLGLVSLRNDVAHHRSVDEKDLDHLVEVCQALVQSGFGGGKMSEIFSQFGESNFETQAKLAQITSDVLNNLPIQEYGDTGFIGRSKLIDTVVRDLKSKSNLNSFIWLTGLGGLGKTAIAREIAERLMWDSEQPFQVIIWVSFKLHELTAEGTTAIRESLVSVCELIQEFPLVASGAEASLGEIFQELGQLETLIIFDNCETYPGEIQELIDSNPPDSISFLFTSRQRGEFGRSIPVPPMDHNECKYYLSKLNKSYPSHDIDQLLRGDKPLRDAIAAVGSTPLGLKWLARACNLGAPIDQVLTSNRDEFLRYCVENVYQAISPSARRVLHCVQIAKEPLSMGDLMVLLTGISAEELQSHISELTRAGLLQPLINEYRAEYAVDELTKTFISISGVVPATEVKELQQILKQRRASVAKTSGIPTYSPYAVDGRDLEPLVYSELIKLLKPASKQSLTTIELVEQAKQLIESSPRYWETYRVLGELYSWSGLIAESIDCHETAVARCPEDRPFSLSRCHYLLAVKLRDVDEARSAREYGIAAALNECFDTVVAYGKSLTYVLRFKEAEDVLLRAQELAESDIDRHHAASAEFECLKRQCEGLNGERLFVGAIRVLEYWLASPSLVWDCPPMRKLEILDSLLDGIGYLSSAVHEMTRSEDQPVAGAETERLLIRIDDALVAWGSSDWVDRIETPKRHYVHKFASILQFFPTFSAQLSERIGHALAVAARREAPVVQGRLKVWYSDESKKYGFAYVQINSKDIDVYFNYRSLRDKSDEILLKSGQPTVNGQLIEGDEGRYFLLDVTVTNG